ncbi:LIC_10042 family TonB-like protein [Leptospira borgpetersenii]|uniref:TonB C-terminal domain-containing protein n=1 Tax=Leptospira borgpetersenii str. Brem 328 TaxID=1049780 RepID=A0ABC9SJ70_LEPBO|nr:hypothetical protein [Leptospira borgpetersenii]EMN14582.1 hypothetical protein LEP1GSC055_0774 [Leptospira borgpetersenii str. Brem 307]EMN17786.1 hypothetical protein LEP1GSC056_2772 [Leptospira borgpetersenii str. Brem 328]
MSAKLSFFISGSFHILLFLFFSTTFFKFPQIEDLKIHLKKGVSQNVTLSFLEEGVGKNSKSFMPKNSNNAGTLQNEIEKFKNEIHFPQGALDQRLESDCSWEVRIKSDGKGEIFKTLHPCKYPIFEVEFNRALRTWKFDLKDGTSLIIPVSFKVYDREF